MQRDDVGIFEPRQVDVLVGLHLGERSDAVADAPGDLELKSVARYLHALRQTRLHLAAVAGQEFVRFADQCRVVFPTDAIDAGCAAALDVELQAGPRPAAEDVVRTVAQQKGALERGDGPVHSAGRREGTEITPVAFARASMFDQLGEIVVLGDQDVRESLVVAQQHVVTRPQLLDQIRFQQQRFDFGVRGHELHRAGFRDHPLQPDRQLRWACIGRDALAQLMRLADIKCVAALIEHAVYAGRAGQGLQIGLDDCGARSQSAVPFAAAGYGFAAGSRSFGHRSNSHLRSRASPRRGPQIDGSRAFLKWLRFAPIANA